MMAIWGITEGSHGVFAAALEVEYRLSLSSSSGGMIFRSSIATGEANRQIGPKVIQLSCNHGNPRLSTDPSFLIR